MDYGFQRLFPYSKIVEYVTDKRLSAKSYIDYMVIRLTQMFKYENLPDTIPFEVLEQMLLVNGTAFITKVNSKLYAFVGGFGGEPDVYYRPTRYTVANPALRTSFYAAIDTDAPPETSQFKVGEDGVIVRNDHLWKGLLPLMARYATLMAENVVTMRTADVMLRVVALISAPDDKTKMAADLYLKKLEKGELSAVGESRFFDGIKMQSPPSNNGSYLTQFIELQQYLKGSFYNEIGLNANYNMKREAIGKNESSLNEDALLPLVDDMLACRKEDMERVSEMFSISPPISVDFNSAWLTNVRQMNAELEVMEQQVDTMQFTVSNDGTRRLANDTENSENVDDMDRRLTDDTKDSDDTDDKDRRLTDGTKDSDDMDYKDRRLTRDEEKEDK